jgi:hypothetical protein
MGNMDGIDGGFVFEVVVHVVLDVSGSCCRAHDAQLGV